MATVEGEAVRSGRRRRRRALINSCSKRTSRGMMMILLFSTVLFIILTYTHGEETTTTTCSCSPRAFLFKLDLATGFCPQVYPASNLFGSGVKDYTCRISLSPNTSENGDAVEAIIDPPRIIQKKEAVVNSIQFIEVDTKFNVLHTSLVKDVELISGDSFRYTTMQQGDKVAGGISIILRGKNAVGDESENVFTVTYTNECGVPTFQGGEKIGWVTVENLIPASGKTCDDVATFNAPSSSSSTATPTVKPSVPSSGGAIQRTPDVILKEVLKLVNDEGDNLFSGVPIPPGFAFLVEQALAAYYDSLIFDAIYRTTDASKLLACDQADDNDFGASKSLICGLLSEALCGLAMDIGEASIGESVRSPTFHPSSGATTTVAIDLTSPPTIVARPVQD
eukprot:scaffold170_cov129-Skeletonema_dohrnii-CCMP3373.AAC.4